MKSTWSADAQQRIIVSPATPQASAELFKSTVRPNLIRHQDVWHDWNGAAYEPVENASVEAQLSAFLGSAYERGFEDGTDEDGNDVRSPKFFKFNPKKAHIAEAYAMLGHSCHVPMNTMAPPSWLTDTPAEYAALDPKNLISFQNGLLDISTRKLYAATPKFFTMTALAIDYDADAPSPELWLEFLREVTRERQPLVDLIQEMLGYLISPDTSMHKVFFLWGRPRSGKGTILRITTALVGKNNVSFPTIDTLAGRFGLQGLIGKSVAQVTDMNTQSRSDLGTAASRINGISGEDGQTVERKNISDWNGKLGSRFQIAGNTLPNFGSHTPAMVTRLVIAPFDVSFVGREDRDLTDRLLLELPGIMLWALEGLDRLRMVGDFVEPDISKAAKTRLIFLSNPIHGFAEERCVISVGALVTKSVLYDAYTAHCHSVGAHPKPLGDFTEQLIELYPTIKSGRRRIGNGERVQMYSGIGLNAETAARVYMIDAELSDMLGEVAFKIDDNGLQVARAVADFDA
jgi:putative DNA primase/helicase